MGLPRCPIPLVERIHRPVHGLIIVTATLATGIRHTQFLGQIRPRDTNTVVGAIVDHHERLFRHVAFHT
jgi:hypothetical protein